MDIEGRNELPRFVASIAEVARNYFASIIGDKRLASCMNNHSCIGRGDAPERQHSFFQIVTD